MGLDRVRAWGQRGAVALRAVVEEVEGATVGSGVEVAEAAEVAEVTVRRGAVVVVEEEEARIPQGEVVVEVQDIARTSYVATCRAFPVDEIFLRKCVVSVSFRFVIGFLNSFDFGGGFSFGGVVVTVAKRPFPYLSISFSTFFQRSKTCIGILPTMRPTVPTFISTLMDTRFDRRKNTAMRRRRRPSMCIRQGIFYFHY